MSELWSEYVQYLEGFGIQAPEPNFAFSKKSRGQIWRRDRGKCQNHDKCPFEDDYLEAAHLVQGSDSPKDGRLSCRPTHYLDHAMGASEHTHHQASARLIWERMTDEEKDWIKLNHPDHGEG